MSLKKSKKVKKDDTYYQKLYKKLKKEKYDPVFELKKAISWYQLVIIVLYKNYSKDGELVLKREELEAVGNDEVLSEDFNKEKNIVFKVEKVKPQRKK